MAVKDESLEIQEQEVTEPISDNQEVSTVDNSMPTNDTYTLDNANQKINDMYDAMNKATTEQYEGQLEVAKQEAEQQRPTIEKEYNDNANDLAYQYNINRRNMAMTDRSNGLSTGTFYERQNALSQKYTSTYAQNQTAKADALAQVDVQLAKLESEYRNQISQAITKNDIARAQALYDEWNNGYTRDKAQADTLAQYGDFTGYQKLGYTDEQIQQMVDEYNRQKDIEDLSAKLQKAATLAASGDFSGYLEAGYSEQEVANMRNYWIYSNPMAAYILGMITLDQYNKIINGEYFEMDGAGTGTDLTGGGTGTGSGGTGTGGTGSGSSGSGSGGGSSSGGGSGSGGGSSSGGGGSGSGGSGGGDYSGGTSSGDTTGGTTTKSEEKKEDIPDNKIVGHENSGNVTGKVGETIGSSDLSIGDIMDIISGGNNQELIGGYGEIKDDTEVGLAEIDKKFDEVRGMSDSELYDFISEYDKSSDPMTLKLVQYARERLLSHQEAKERAEESENLDLEEGQRIQLSEGKKKIDQMTMDELLQYIYYDHNPIITWGTVDRQLLIYAEQKLQEKETRYKEAEERAEESERADAEQGLAISRKEEYLSWINKIDEMSDEQLEVYAKNPGLANLYGDYTTKLGEYAKARLDRHKATYERNLQEEARDLEEGQKIQISEGMKAIDKMTLSELKEYVSDRANAPSDEMYNYAILTLNQKRAVYEETAERAAESTRADEEQGLAIREKEEEKRRQEELLSLQKESSPAYYQDFDSMSTQELKDAIKGIKINAELYGVEDTSRLNELTAELERRIKINSTIAQNVGITGYEAQEQRATDETSTDSELGEIIRKNEAEKQVSSMDKTQLENIISNYEEYGTGSKELYDAAKERLQTHVFEELVSSKTMEERKEENKNNDYNNTASDLAGATANSGASESGKTGQELLWDLVMQQAEDMTREQIQQRIDAIGSSGDQTVLNAYKYALETKPASTVVSETPVGNEINNKVTATGSNLSQDEKDKVQQAVGRTTNTTVTVGTAAQNQAINRSMGVTTAGNKTTNFGSVTSGRTTTITTKPTSTQNTTYTGPVNTGGTSTNYRSNSASGSRMH